MLAGDDQLLKLVGIDGPLQFQLQMPPAEFFAASGPVPTTAGDKRRFVRTHFHVTAALQYRTSLPTLPRESEWHKIVTCDISRNGIRFLHGAELYPTEQMAVVLPDGKRRLLEIVRCRLLAEHCYEIGATFISQFETP